MNVGGGFGPYVHRARRLLGRGGCVAGMDAEAEALLVDLRDTLTAVVMAAEDERARAHAAALRDEVSSHLHAVAVCRDEPGIGDLAGVLLRRALVVVAAQPGASYAATATASRSPQITRASRR